MHPMQVVESGEEREEDLEAAALLLNNKAQALLQAGPGECARMRLRVCSCNRVLLRGCSWKPRQVCLCWAAVPAHFPTSSCPLLCPNFSAPTCRRHPQRQLQGADDADQGRGGAARPAHLR